MSLEFVNINSACIIADAIFNSKHSSKIENVMLYGSVARYEQNPNDIDMLVIYTGDLLDKYNYDYATSTGLFPERKFAVTQGIINTLGIRNELVEKGLSPLWEKAVKSGKEVHLPQEIKEKMGMYYSIISASPESAKDMKRPWDNFFAPELEIQALNSRFFIDNEYKEKIISQCTDKRFYQDIISEGVLFDTKSRTFSLPAENVYRFWKVK